MLQSMKSTRDIGLKVEADQTFKFPNICSFELLLSIQIFDYTTDIKHYNNNRVDVN